MDEHNTQANSERALVVLTLSTAALVAYFTLALAHI
jgi:hypothetical protein